MLRVVACQICKGADCCAHVCTCCSLAVPTGPYGSSKRLLPSTPTPPHTPQIQQEEMAQCAERLACGAGLLALRPLPGSADWDAFAGLPAGELGVSCWQEWRVAGGCGGARLAQGWPAVAGCLCVAGARLGLMAGRLAAPHWPAALLQLPSSPAPSLRLGFALLTTVLGPAPGPAGELP